MVSRLDENGRGCWGSIQPLILFRSFSFPILQVIRIPRRIYNVLCESCVRRWRAASFEGHRCGVYGPSASRLLPQANRPAGQFARQSERAEPHVRSRAPPRRNRRLLPRGGLGRCQHSRGAAEPAFLGPCRLRPFPLGVLRLRGARLVQLVRIGHHRRLLLRLPRPR